MRVLPQCRLLFRRRRRRRVIVFVLPRRTAGPGRRRRREWAVASLAAVPSGGRPCPRQAPPAAPAMGRDERRGVRFGAAGRSRRADSLSLRPAVARAGACSSASRGGGAEGSPAAPPRRGPGPNAPAPAAGPCRDEVPNALLNASSEPPPRRLSRRLPTPTPRTGPRPPRPGHRRAPPRTGVPWRRPTAAIGPVSNSEARSSRVPTSRPRESGLDASLVRGGRPCVWTHYFSTNGTGCYTR